MCSSFCNINSKASGRHFGDMLYLKCFLNWKTTKCLKIVYHIKFTSFSLKNLSGWRGMELAQCPFPYFLVQPNCNVCHSTDTVLSISEPLHFYLTSYFECPFLPCLVHMPLLPGPTLMLSLLLSIPWNLKKEVICFSWPPIALYSYCALKSLKTHEAKW